jgi:putative membrane protein
MRFGLLFSLLLAILAVIFALQNPQPMDVNLLFFQTEGSTALVLILTFGFGVLVGLLSSVPARLRTRRKLKELQKKQSDENTGSSTSASQASSKPSSKGNRSSPPSKSSS